MTSIYIVLTGLLVRFIVPLLLMVGLVFLLRRMDARWQKEAINRQLLETSTAQSRTWELSHCTIAGMANQPAIQSGQPCWLVYRKSNGYLHEECLHCKVFCATPILLPS